LIIKELTYSHILKDISFTLDTGNICCVLGENGSGKTTLLRSIAGIHKRYSGSVKIQGKELSEYTPQDLSLHRSMLTQKNTVYSQISCKDYVATARSYDEKKLEQIVQKLSISDLLDKKYSDCSGGEQQKIDITRVTLQACSLRQNDSNYYLILDEPFNSLDVKYLPVLSSYLYDLRNDGFTIIMVIHDLNLAYQLANQVLFLKNGSVVDFGNKEQVFNVVNLQKTFDIPFIDSEIGGRRFFHIEKSF
jgi:iron complex transport system ATP-binding protein